MRSFHRFEGIHAPTERVAARIRHTHQEIHMGELKQYLQGEWTKLDKKGVLKYIKCQRGRDFMEVTPKL